MLFIACVDDFDDFLHLTANLLHLSLGVRVEEYLALREWIKKEVDSTADSIFSYTSSEDVQLCIDMLKSLPEFLNDNVQKHRNMSAALDQYLLFIEEREKGNMN